MINYKVVSIKHNLIFNTSENYKINKNISNRALDLYNNKNCMCCDNNNSIRNIFLLKSLKDNKKYILWVCVNCIYISKKQNKPISLNNTKFLFAFLLNEQKYIVINRYNFN